MTLLERCYNGLTGAGLDARLANTLGGTAACVSNYCTIIDGVTESAGKTICYRHMTVAAYVPRDKAARLPGYAAEIRAAMIHTGLTLYSAGATQTNDDNKSVCLQMDFRALCAL